MDPLDPLTEIINSGQAFSLSIALERIVWLILGMFFIGAISTSIFNRIRYQNLPGKSNFENFKGKANKIEDSQ